MKATSFLLAFSRNEEYYKYQPDFPEFGLNQRIWIQQPARPTQGAKHQRQNETTGLNQPKNKIMKQFLLVFFVAFALLLGGRTTSMAGGSGRTLAAGDIVILALNGDGTDTDDFFPKANDFEKATEVVDEMVKKEQLDISLN